MLSLTEVTNVTEAIVGDSIKYTITIHNSGLSNATDVKIWNILPANVRYISGADTYNETTRNATWTIDKIWAGKSVEIHVVVNATVTGNLTNVIFANSAENKTVVNKTSNNITVNPNVMLSVEKSADVSSVVVGDLVKYTITVHNNGLSDATDIKVWDILPTNVKYVSGADTYNEVTRNATWTIDKIWAGKSVEIHVVVNATATGNLTNVIFANSAENKTVVNKTSDKITVIPNIILSLTEVANVTEVVVGESIKYTITVHNSGLSDATDIKVWDILPTSVKYISGADTYNKATVNKTSDNITVIPNVILSLTEVTNVTEIIVGESIKYTITVHNSGLSDATDVKVWNILPANVKYVSGADTYNEATRKIRVWR
ncbi:hypothetical protein [uncultured Methanobrevibacter sp.]|uniref:hypothetical protein n=1 Tax=uncultured Methanobrevibacter sp. TaxID=253161 RepID=UPI0025DB4C66|nr:hypothetical protein [uncultured Methanobrevibacter sp.]